MLRVRCTACLLFLVGCAGTVQQLNPKAIKQSATFAGFECHAPIIVRDARRSETEHFKHLATEQALDWLRGSLQAITDNRLVFLDETDGASNAVTIELRHAYVANKLQSKVGIVSITARQNNYEESFRGHSAKMNWWGSTLEYTLQLNVVMKEALLKFARSPKFCRYQADGSVP